MVREGHVMTEVGVRLIPLLGGAASQRIQEAFRRGEKQEVPPILEGIQCY